VLSIEAAEGLDNVNQADAWCTQLRFFSAGTSNNALGYWSHIALGDAATDGIDGAATLQPRVTSSFATADGADETGAQTGGTGGSAYTAIDETTPDDTDFIDLDPGERTSFIFNAPPLMGRCLGIQSVARVFKTDSDVVTGRPYLTIGGTRYYGDTVAVPADVAYLTYLWNLHPVRADEFVPADFPIEAGWERVA
jgi:hypothetical protein